GVGLSGHRHSHCATLASVSRAGKPPVQAGWVLGINVEGKGVAFLAVGRVGLKLGAVHHHHLDAMIVQMKILVREKRFSGTGECRRISAGARFTFALSSSAACRSAGTLAWIGWIARR